MASSQIIILAIIATSLATFVSRFMGALTSEKVSVKSKLFQWFNCVAYSTLAALLGRMIIFPAGVLAESDLIIRSVVVVICVVIFILSKKNLVIPTIFSALWLKLKVGFPVGKFLMLTSVPVGILRTLFGMHGILQSVGDFDEYIGSGAALMLLTVFYAIILTLVGYALDESEEELKYKADIKAFFLSLFFYMTLRQVQNYFPRLFQGLYFLFWRFVEQVT